MSDLHRDKEGTGPTEGPAVPYPSISPPHTSEPTAPTGCQEAREADATAPQQLRAQNRKGV